ncbi:MAG: hypothetical protein L0211_01915 [Planctomycetaceae bacterium]|nr:hypothetical protein [Planctomycetaceae bacterium]
MEPNPYEAPKEDGHKRLKSWPDRSGWFVLGALGLLFVLSLGVALLATCLVAG